MIRQNVLSVLAFHRRLQDDLPPRFLNTSKHVLRRPSPARGLVDKARREIHVGAMDMTAKLDREPPALQRAAGEARLHVRQQDGATRLDRLYQSGSAKVRFCASQDSGREAVLINTAGGLTGGDRFCWTVNLAAGARCSVVTQACEKIYRSTGEAARVGVKLTVEAGASLEWLPQETILFEGSNLARTFDIRVEPGGRLLAVEGVIIGRKAMGETAIQARLHDRWRVQWGERLIFADNLKLDIAASTVGRPALLRNSKAFALILLLDYDAEARLGAVRDVLGDIGGASAWDGKLVCRVAATDGLALRRILVAVMGILRGGVAPPRLWTV
jgi:urease accessory protein